MIESPMFQLEYGHRLYVKAEVCQPSRSIKYRAASYMISNSLYEIRNNSLTVLESSSGNTGIAVAKICQELKLPCLIIIPENTRRSVSNQISSLGADMIVTIKSLGSDGSKAVAQEMYEEHPEKYCYLDQYSNPFNPRAHFDTTGPEVWYQSEGKITHFVTGVGTGGTISGVGMFLKMMNPSIQIIGVQPKDWYGISGLRRLEDSFTPKIYNDNVIDDTLFVSTKDVVDLYNSTKYYGGFSTMANILAYHQIPYDKDNFVVTMMPDGSSYHHD